MPSDCTYIPYQDTNSFSKLVVDYQAKPDSFTPFVQFTPNQEGIKKAIAQRPYFEVDRAALVSTLKKQYSELEPIDAVSQNINSLEANNTYTVCTAHQPNLLTGYLYFVYKIIHAIKLAEELNNTYPDQHFVPVYYMGSEDNDLDELGTFKYEGKKYVWDGDGQTGAVGRMATTTLKPLLTELFAILGPPGIYTDELKELLIKAYINQPTIAKATQYLVHQLFGKYGLVVIDPDEAVFKKNISHIIKDDLLNHAAKGLVEDQVTALESAGYKSQAYPRPINLFYMNDGVRERIEQEGDKWQVINTDISWDEQSLLAELDKHPERFSPNVILRGLMQETMLPNVAFIGGGAEVAYWMQLKPVFDHYKVFYPVVMQRQSVLWITSEYAGLRKKTGLSIQDLFRPVLELETELVKEHSGTNWQTQEEHRQLEELLKSLQKKATNIDSTLTASAEAALTKMKKQLTVLEKKMLKAEKRKSEVIIGRMHRLTQGLHPMGGLQERTENFISYYTLHGNSFFDRLKEATLPYNEQFLVIEDEE